MEELGPHQAAMVPHQVDANLHQAESRGSQHSNPFVNLQQREIIREVRTQLIPVKASLEGKVVFPMQRMIETCKREIDELKKELRRARRRHSSPNFKLSFEETDDATYRRRSRTSPSETFSYDEEYRHRRRYKSPPCKGLGNDFMNKALSQVSKSPFTRNIEGASLPRRFHQSTFTIYNC